MEIGKYRTKEEIIKDIKIVLEKNVKDNVPEVNQLIGEDDEQAAEKGYTPWATL